tara:strand:- start:82 stop:663 length:582 start_codon:yes stop_codon:yes gene_type:complete
MRKTILVIFYLLFIANNILANEKINTIYEGNPDAKIKLIIYESLTCSHCANFHKNVYPKLKENFIDKGYIKIEFKNFPLDMAALNASKIAHCKNDGKSDILHFLFENQEKWAQGNKIEDINSNIKKILDTKKYGIDFEKCIINKKIEDHILEDRIEAVKKFKLNSTPTLIINNKKFDKALNYKNIKKTLEKMI